MTYLKKFVGTESLNSVQNSVQQEQKLISLQYLPKIMSPSTPPLARKWPPF